MVPRPNHTDNSGLPQQYSVPLQILPHRKLFATIVSDNLLNSGLDCGRITETVGSHGPTKPPSALLPTPTSSLLQLLDWAMCHMTAQKVVASILVLAPKPVAVVANGFDCGLLAKQRQSAQAQVGTSWPLCIQALEHTPH